jgi:hypothetical protein
VQPHHRLNRFQGKIEAAQRQGFLQLHNIQCACGQPNGR